MLVGMRAARKERHERERELEDEHAAVFLARGNQHSFQ